MHCQYYLSSLTTTTGRGQVALVHGFSMGGGASLMVPLKFSVVTEKTVSSEKIVLRVLSFFWGLFFINEFEYML